MSSKLISLSPHEAQIQFEVSLRESYHVNQPRLTPPLKYTILSNEEYLNINRAIVYGVLCEPTLANVCVKYLNAHVNDGYCFFVKLLVQIVDGLFPKLLEFPKVQLIWVVSLMIDVCGVGFDSLVVSLLRQIVGGDCSDGNLWLSYEMVNLLSSKWDLILDEEPLVLGYGLYTYLRMLADHYRLPRNPSSTELKQKEIGFCVRVLREQFHLCLRIGRDLVRLLQDLIHIPEFRAIWRDLLVNPSSFGVSVFSDISLIYGTRTSSRYFLLRITPEMETQLRFLLMHVKLGSQRRHQVWFARKFFFGPGRETLISDIVRFICCAHHPSNEVLQSDVIPRWAVIGWLLSLSTKKYIEASVKLALFYDWLFFDEKVDNFMNVEPAMLLMVNSIPKYVDMTSSLLEFLLLLVENYDMDRKNVMLKGVSSVLNLLVRKGVIASLNVLTSCSLLSPLVKKNLHSFMLKIEHGDIPEPPQPKLRFDKVPPSLSPVTSLMESEQNLPNALPSLPMNDEINTEQNSISDFIDTRATPGVNNLDCVEDVAYLIGKIGDYMKSSGKMGQQIMEKILLLCSCGSPGKPSDVNSETLACQLKAKLDLADYKLFSPLHKLVDSDEADDEIQSVTATVIRAFIFTQHVFVRDMLYWWSKNGCLVGTRLLSYALRLAYEAHEGGYRANFADEKNTAPPLLKFHVEGFLTFLSRNRGDVNGNLCTKVNVDQKMICKMIDDAYSAYRSFMFAYSRTVLSKDLDGKLLSFHAVSSSLWKSKRMKFVFHDIFLHLSDLSLGNQDLIQLLCSQLEEFDIMCMQIDLGLKRYALFGEDVQNFLELIRRSVSWKQADQLNFWGLATSELIISGFPVEKLLLCCFFSDDIDPKGNGTAFSGLMTLCNCHAPSAEIVGALMVLPNNKFPDFAAAVFSHWAYVNEAMLSNSIIEFFDKSENFEFDGNVINQSAVLFLLKYLEEHGELGHIMLGKWGLNLSDIKTRLDSLAVAMDTA